MHALVCLQGNPLQEKIELLFTEAGLDPRQKLEETSWLAYAPDWQSFHDAVSCLLSSRVRPKVKWAHMDTLLRYFRIPIKRVTGPVTVLCLLS